MRNYLQQIYNRIILQAMVFLLVGINTCLAASKTDSVVKQQRIIPLGTGNWWEYENTVKRNGILLQKYEVVNTKTIDSTLYYGIIISSHWANSKNIFVSDTIFFRYSKENLMEREKGDSTEHIFFSLDYSLNTTDSCPKKPKYIVRSDKLHYETLAGKFDNCIVLESIFKDNECEKRIFKHGIGLIAIENSSFTMLLKDYHVELK
jgi:hypothetical protein